jgi:PAS domain S-box-containing protein
MQPVGTQLRKTGIGVLGDVPWGAHFFMFYETKEDLLDTLVPYFQAGLETGEFCFWVLSEPLTEKEATNALRKAVPELDRYVADHSIEILRGRQFYLHGKDLDLKRVLRTWVEKTDSAIARGYAGFRLSADIAWLEHKDRQAFSEYEDELNNSIKDLRMTALCTYPLARSTAAEILDVTRTHQFAIARRNRGWEVVETSELKQAKSEINRLNDELEHRVTERTLMLELVNRELRKEIAERQRAEEALRRSKDDLRVVIDTIPQQIWSGPPDGSLDFCNDRWRSYIGLTQAELQGDGWQRMLHPDDRERVLKAWRESVVNGTPYEQEERHRGADGQYRWFLARGVPLRDSQGRIVKWYGTNTDIEGRRRAEDALYEAQAELAHVTRVIAMGELVTSIAHEVNQPLTAVVTNANFALRQVATGMPNLEELREALAEIANDGTRASTVISRIRTLLKKGTPEKVELDINEVIRDVTIFVRNEATRSRVSVRPDLAANLPSVLGDRVQLQQVLINLIVNSIEAMRPIDDRPRDLFIKSAKNADGVLIQVQDSGKGIDLGQGDSIFEPFFTTKPQGIGMGLSISRSIIESHGGRLWSVPHSPGALFQFTLPTNRNSVS